MRVAKLCADAEINPKGPRPGELDPNQIVDFVPMADVKEDGSMSVSAQRNYCDVAKGYTAFKNGDVIMAKITRAMRTTRSQSLE